jgi:cobalt/nickel transport system permease protein
MLAVSMALLIQALFFGDGGVTAFGANCFNMAIVGSIVAYLVYRLISGGSSLRSKQRVFAAAVAGYTAINASAFCAAVEFGIQPRLFHDASGTPLYAPYPLHVAIPAMMIGHLTIAGLAELVITASLVSYLQRANVHMLRKTAPSALLHVTQSSVRTLRGLWITLAALVVLTPLGILAAGKAWGEWKVGDFSDISARTQILAASGNHSLPSAPPSGLARLSEIWQAPLAEYSPNFVHNPAVGYLLSAVVGVTLILISLWFVQWSLARGTRKRGNFIEKTIRGLLTAGQEALFAENVAQRNGLLQRLDPRVKIAGLGGLILAAVSVRKLSVLLALFALSVACALASQISVRFLASKVWLAVLAFTGMIAVPAIFLGTGPELFHIPFFEWPIYLNGLRSALFLVLRAETTATFSLLLILTTLWNRLLRSLRFLGVPASAIAIVSMTYRYIFVFLESSKNTLEARQSRLVGQLEPAIERRLAAASVGALLDKTINLSGDVYVAMQARGFRGEIRLLNDLSMQMRDWWQLSAFLTIAILAFGLGR